LALIFLSPLFRLSSFRTMLLSQFFQLYCGLSTQLLDFQLQATAGVPFPMLIISDGSEKLLQLC
jgi:hypothetical protein